LQKESKPNVIDRTTCSDRSYLDAKILVLAQRIAVSIKLQKGRASNPLPYIDFSEEWIREYIRKQSNTHLPRLDHSLCHWSLSG